MKHESAREGKAAFLKQGTPPVSVVEEHDGPTRPEKLRARTLMHYA